MLASPLLADATVFVAPIESAPPIVRALLPETWLVAVLLTIEPEMAASKLVSV